jgi:hypothetical protein
LGRSPKISPRDAPEFGRSPRAIGKKGDVRSQSGHMGRFLVRGELLGSRLSKKEAKERRAKVCQSRSIYRWHDHIASASGHIRDIRDAAVPFFGTVCKIGLLFLAVLENVHDLFKCPARPRCIAATTSLTLCLLRRSTTIDLSFLKSTTGRPMNERPIFGSRTWHDNNIMHRRGEVQHCYL